MLKRAVLTFTAAYTVLCVYVSSTQQSLLYFPFDTRVLPAEAGLPNVSEVTLTTADGDRLYSWWHAPAPGKPIFLFFQGNGGSAVHRVRRFASWIEKGYGVFALGYPGYGGSDGTPSEESISAASELAWQWLGDRGVAGDDVVIYGESLGSAVAVKLAARYQSRAVVLEAPMSSVREVAKTHYPYLPVTALLRDPWLSVELVADIATPLLIFHGDRDAIVPIESGRALFDAAVDPKEFRVVQGAGHNDLFRRSLIEQVEEYLARIPD